VNNAALFQENFSPYRSVYLQQNRYSLFPGEVDTQWLTVEEYLTDPMIHRAILDKALYGFLLAYKHPLFRR
jgi:hypothetical protein